MSVILELRNVHKAFGDNRVLQGLSLAVEVGETFVLLGRSGSGKTVILKLIEGLLQPDRGEVLLEGHDLQTVSGKELRALRGLLGVQFQSGALFDSMSVFDNVAFPLRERRLLPTKQAIEQRVTETLAMVGLSDADPSGLRAGLWSASADFVVRRPNSRTRPDADRGRRRSDQGWQREARRHGAPGHQQPSHRLRAR
jgi:phospholipid/cholesterol/gamma-HCH transport system ATP-binding protein